MKVFYKIVTFTLILICSSCVKDLDFNQANDLELEPALALSLVNFELDQEEVSGLGVVFIPTVVDESVLPNLRNSLIQEDLDSVVLQFEASNTFDDDFTINVVFFDINNNPTYAVTPIIIDGNNETFTYEEEIMIASNPNFLNSYKVAVALSYNGTFIDLSEANSFQFKSASILNFSIN